jgi:hypothetical protein
VPLSEHEQRLLDQIERALYDEDPKFASTVRSTDLRTHMRRRMIRAAAIFVVGLVLLPVGVITEPVIGMSAYRRLGSAHTGSPGSSGSAPGGRDELSERRQRSQRGSRRSHHQGGFRQRVEERWQRRMDERGGDH